MIHIEFLSINNFRGIKRLDLSLGQQSFGICGNNGTGKSGVVDAIEFALTGNITRLTGKGMHGVSVKEHGPHVDSWEEPEKSVVILKAFFPDLKKTATIERCMRKPQDVKVSPPDADVLKAVAVLAEHPEFALSRREILKYVLTAPGDRSKAVQELLKINDVEVLRASLKKVVNTCKSEMENAEMNAESARNRLMAALRVEELKSDLILKAVNQRRKTLGLEALSVLEKDTTLKDGLATAGGAAKKGMDKKTALGELEKLGKLLLEDPPELSKSISKIVSTLVEFEKNPILIKNLRRQAFLTKGLDFIIEASCPFCDMKWGIEELKAHVLKKIKEAVNAVKAKEAMAGDVLRVRKVAGELDFLLGVAEGYGKTLSVPDGLFGGWRLALRDLSAQLESLDDVTAARSALKKGWHQVPDEGRKVLTLIEGKVKELPELSKEEEARDFLTVCQERLEHYRQEKRRHSALTEHHSLAVKAFAVYGKSSESVLKGLYQEVEADFSRYYRLINHEDESDFKGLLTPSLGSLGFEVNFFGRGMFPPGAYHSEGHQDGMGLCLYLALMKRIMGDQFTFAVLDDVLMSVDAGHRKEVCKLLKTEFPGTQFVFTTHDPVWLKHMVTEGMVNGKSVVHFRNWTVEGGPTVWDHKDLWTEISEDLEKDDVPGAAHDLRRSLEYVFHDLADGLRAKVEYRSGGIYDLGDILPPVCLVWEELMGKAIKSAESWEKGDKADALRKMLADFKEKYAKAQVERWPINKAVHYTEWANLQKEDFQTVVVAFHTLVDCFRCKECQAWVHVNPSRGQREILHCDCASFDYSLKSKPKEK